MKLFPELYHVSIIMVGNIRFRYDRMAKIDLKIQDKKNLICLNIRMNAIRKRSDVMGPSS
jgi:hypothetical protein